MATTGVDAPSAKTARMPAPLLVAHSDTGGGAARAAHRLHRALIAHGVRSGMQVRFKGSDDPAVRGPATRAAALAAHLRGPLGGLIMRLQKSGAPGPRSGNFVPSRWAKEINASESSVVNLHWIGAETLSIEDVARIRKPVVWTLHDMWAFCGAEHVEPDDARWASGYLPSNRRPEDRGIDLDSRVWHRKHKAWRSACRIVTPSSWLGGCASRSALFSASPVTVIPNPIDTDVFKPLDQRFCREALNLPQDTTLVLFGAIRAGADRNKGYDLLVDALRHLAANRSEQRFECVVFGQSGPHDSIPLPTPAHWMGHVRDDATLALLYGAADVMVVPSRTENLPQTATEAQACGCPVVAFHSSGLPDAVEDRSTGFLAQAYDAADLANGMAWVTEDAERLGLLRRAARARAVRLWHPDVIVPKYLEQYHLASEDELRSSKPTR